MGISGEPWEDAARRYHEDRQRRTETLAALARGQSPDTADRLRKSAVHVGEVAIAYTARATRSAELGYPLYSRIGAERIIGGTDLTPLPFLELGLGAARSVGRITVRTTDGAGDGFGTGFLVSPDLVLTNNHVLGAFDDAVKSEITFDYQEDKNRRRLPTTIFSFDPKKFFLTNKSLDYTLVAVGARLEGIRNIEDFSWLKLIASEGKAKLGDALNIIQHPQGGLKRIVFRQNQFISLPRVSGTNDPSPFMHYLSDTEPGSSGSPVFNDFWEVVALHHSAIPKMDEAGNYLDVDGIVWDRRDEQRLAWEANEGVRVSFLVRDIQAASMDAAQEKLRNALLNAIPPDPIETAVRSMVGDSGASTAIPTRDGAVKIVVPLTITLSLGADMQTTVAAPAIDGRLPHPDIGPPPPSPAIRSERETRALKTFEEARRRPYFFRQREKQ
jgi:endonuclease G, mitochondrial